jgi:hypothetical protein
MLEPRLRLRVARECLLAVVAGGHRRLQSAQLLLQRDQVARTRQGVLAQRQSQIEGRTLVVQRHPRSLVEHQLPAVDARLAGQHPEQRRLAGAVGTGEREPLAPLDLEGDAVEQQSAGELLAQVGSDHDSHAAVQARGAV